MFTWVSLTPIGSPVLLDAKIRWSISVDSIEEMDEM